MIIPYKVKNPPRNFPICTVVLMALNVLVFAFTSESFLVVRGSVVETYALNWGVTPPSTILTAMFLHADLLHLIGNMLFLWVFGPAVEDRLRIPGYLGLYLLTGFAGFVAHATLGAVGGQSIPTLGASGSIMGLLGAYWYLFPWSKVCMAYFVAFFIRIRYGLVEVAAVWVIGAYFLLDLFRGGLSRMAGESGGVASFAHVGGAFTGALLLWMLGVKRDSESVSRARETHSEVKSMDLLSVLELKELLRASLDDEEMLVRYANKALDSESADDIAYALQVSRRVVVTQCPGVVVHYLLVMGRPPELLSATDLLYLARWCDQSGSPDQALRVLGILESSYPDSPELEIAFLRAAGILWNTKRDGQRAIACLDSLLQRFPKSMSVFEAEDLRETILQAESQTHPHAA